MSDDIVQVGATSAPSASVESAPAASSPAESTSSEPTNNPNFSNNGTIAPSSLDGDNTVSGWKWSENTSGEGDKPEWFKDGTFKTVEDQAKGYSDLKSKFDKRYGGFTGAPEGDYEISLNEELTSTGYNIDSNSDTFKAFSEMARELNMSQDGFNQALNVFGKYEAEQRAHIQEQMSSVIQQHNDAEIAKLTKDDISKFNSAVKIWANQEGMTQEGINDILKGINSAAGIKDLTNTLMKLVDTPIPTGQNFEMNTLSEDDVFNAHQAWHAAKQKYGEYSAEAMLAEAEKNKLYKQVYGVKNDL